MVDGSKAMVSTFGDKKSHGSKAFNRLIHLIMYDDNGVIEFHNCPQRISWNAASSATT
jgi:hypothetical protein